MSEAAIWSLFLAIVQVEGGGRNGDAVGPAQIKPGVVVDCINWGHSIELKDRNTMQGSFRLFRLYTDRWIARRRLADTPQNRANIWRYGPSSKYVLKGIASPYSTRVEALIQDENRGGTYPDDPKRLYRLKVDD